MPQIPSQDNERMSLRIASKDKSLLMRAAALQHTNLTDFVVKTVVGAAHEVIEQHQRVELSERDTLKMLDLLDNPPQPNQKLLDAAFSMPKSK